MLSGLPAAKKRETLQTLAEGKGFKIERIRLLRASNAKGKVALLERGRVGDCSSRTSASSFQEIRRKASPESGGSCVHPCSRLPSRGVDPPPAKNSLAGRSQLSE